MGAAAIVITGLCTMFVLIALHVPVAAAMAATGVAFFGFLVSFEPAFKILGSEVPGFLSSLDLAVIPMFVLMGGFATASGLSSDIYRLAHAWLGHVRGGLAIATIGTCAGFGTICGSSIATAATMSKIAFPEMHQRKYDLALAAGSVAAGSSLGILIPPSIILVIYALLTEQSLLALFAAAVVPGFLAAITYMAAIWIYVRLSPTAAPSLPRTAWAQRASVAGRSWRFLLLALAVGGGIYGGVFTVNEAAAVGVALAFLFFVLSGNCKRAVLSDVLGETAKTTCLLFLVIIGASTMAYFVSVSNAPAELVTWIEDLGLPRVGVIAVLIFIYLILGSIFDTTAGMVITLPVVFPLVTGLGYDPVWWGVIMVVMIEMGMITPPIGMNVFVLHGMVPHVPMKTIFRGIMPFLIADFGRLSVLVIFPEVVLWLPRLLGIDLR